jgi:hypothetical protein
MDTGNLLSQSSRTEYLKRIHPRYQKAFGRSSSRPMRLPVSRLRSGFCGLARVRPLSRKGFAGSNQPPQDLIDQWMVRSHGAKDSGAMTISQRKTQHCGGGAFFRFCYRFWGLPPIRQRSAAWGRSSDLCAWGSTVILSHVSQSKFSPDSEGRSVPSPQSGQWSPDLGVGDSACWLMAGILARPSPAGTNRPRSDSPPVEGQGASQHKASGSEATHAAAEVAFGFLNRISCSAASMPQRCQGLLATVGQGTATVPGAERCRARLRSCPP